MSRRVRQKGAALIVTLVLIAVALVLGLSSYQSSRLEESMAGNYRAASRAQMAAEYAAAAAWSNEFRGSTTVASDAIDTLTEVSLAGASDNSEFSALDLKAYYLVTPYSDGSDTFGRYDVVAIGEVSQDPPVYRYVQYLARLALGPGSALVAAGEDPGVADDCADSVELISATSGAFAVEGEEEVFGSLKAAIQVACPAAMTELANAITDGDEDAYSVSDGEPKITTCEETNGKNNLCNYVGGIQGGIDIDIFKNPSLMAEFLYEMKAKKTDGIGSVDINGVEFNVFSNLLDVDEAEVDGITFVTSTPYVGGVETWVDYDGVPIDFIDANGDDQIDSFEMYDAISGSGLSIGTTGLNPSKSKLRGGAVGCGEIGKTGASSSFDCGFQGGDQPRVDYSFNGNITGSGVLVIDGNVDFGGVPAFEGLIIVLGDYAVTGGGGGEFNGSVVSAPIIAKSSDDGMSSISGFGDVVGSYWVGNTLSCFDDPGVVCGFDGKILQFTGGGTALYNYDLDKLLNATSYLDSAMGEVGDSGKLPSQLLAYGNGEEALYYYALNYRQSFEEPPLLAEKIGTPPWEQYVEPNP